MILRVLKKNKTEGLAEAFVGDLVEAEWDWRWGGCLPHRQRKRGLENSRRTPTLRSDRLRMYATGDSALGRRSRSERHCL